MKSLIEANQDLLNRAKFAMRSYKNFIHHLKRDNDGDFTEDYLRAMNEFVELRHEVKNIFNIQADNNYHRNWRDACQNTERFINSYGKI